MPLIGGSRIDPFRRYIEFWRLQTFRILLLFWLTNYASVLNRVISEKIRETECFFYSPIQESTPQFLNLMQTTSPSIIPPSLSNYHRHHHQISTRINSNENGQHAVSEILYFFLSFNFIRAPLRATLFTRPHLMSDIGRVYFPITLSTTHGCSKFLS